MDKDIVCMEIRRHRVENAIPEGIDLMMAISSPYRLIKHSFTYASKREDWNPREVTEDSWWIYGHGISRPATEIEVALWVGREDLEDEIEYLRDMLDKFEARCKKLPPCGLLDGHEGSCNTSKEYGV